MNSWYKTPEQLEEEMLEASTPSSVSMRQARLALLQFELLDLVDDAIASIEDPIQRKSAEIEWEYATTVERYSEFVQNVAAGLKLSEEQMRNLFIVASKL